MAAIPIPAGGRPARRYHGRREAPPPGDVWDTRLGFTAPLPVVPAGRYTATVTFTVSVDESRDVPRRRHAHARARARSGGRGHDPPSPRPHRDAGPRGARRHGEGKRPHHESGSRARSWSTSAGPGFSLDLRGRPRVVARAGPRAATASGLTVQPGRFVLPAGARRNGSPCHHRLPRRVEPGDHDALDPAHDATVGARPGVAVRMRIGVVVVVRAPGSRRPVRSPSARCAFDARRSRTERSSSSLSNRGNVTERVDASPGPAPPLVRKGGRDVGGAETREACVLGRTASCSSATEAGWRAGLPHACGSTLRPGRPVISRTFRVKL